MFILALSGSLRDGSTNTALIGAAKVLAPKGAEVLLWNAQDQLPHFNPDLETAVPPVVQEFRDLVGRADGLLFAVPEYARGLPGAFKNALDWLVGGDTFVRKYFVQWNASPRASEAQKSLRLVLETMSGLHVDEAALALPLIKQQATPQSLAAQYPDEIKAALAAFVTALRTRGA